MSALFSYRPSPWTCQASWVPGETCSHFPLAACRISRVTARGRETIGRCDARTSTMSAWARSAMNRCCAGGMTLSAVPTRYQLGSSSTRERRRASAVGVSDEHDRTRDCAEIAGQVSGVARQAAQRVRRHADGVSAVLEALRDARPARAIRPRSVDEDDGELRMPGLRGDRRLCRGRQDDRGQHEEPGDAEPSREIACHEMSFRIGRNAHSVFTSPPSIT